MRLTRVQVTGLFGIFSHEILLNLEERITIIHGPNGFGKTIVLRMIAALVSGQYSLFAEVPFETFTVEFDIGFGLIVAREEAHSQEQANPQPRISISSCGSGETQSWSLGGALLAGKSIERAVDHALGESARATQLIMYFSEREIRRRRKEYLVEQEPEWLARARAGFPMVRLVRTQRLDIEEEHEQRDAGKSTVDAYSNDLAERIRKTLAEYAARSQELDRTFPTRLLSQPNQESLAAEELRKQLSELESKRAALTGLGFLDPEQGLDPASSQAIEGKRDVLSIYVADMQSKLSIFDDVASKIRLFTRIINERFLLKRLEISREHGFVFTSITNARLKPSDLSSGEQHELILFYELIFKLRENALVLIDEPEISLHVAWQEKFLEDLSEAVKLSGVDVLLATHSPEIIGNHWDLTVELKAPSEARQG